MEEDSGVVSGLAGKGWYEGVNLSIHRYYMETKLNNTIPEKIHSISKEIENELLLLSEHIEIELLVVFDDNAFKNIGLKDRDFPVVFTGVSGSLEKYNETHYFYDSLHHPGRNTTGVLEPYMIIESIQTMSVLFPNIIGKKLLFLFDNTTTGKGHAEYSIPDVSPYLKDIYNITTEVRIISTMQELEKSVMEINEDDFIQSYATPINVLFDEISEEVYNAQKVFSYIVHHIHPSNGKAEIAVSSINCQYGLLGGVGPGIRHMGEQTGWVCGDILNKEISPGDIAITSAAPSLYFNLDRANAFGISIENQKILDYANVLFQSSSNENSSSIVGPLLTILLPILVFVMIVFSCFVLLYVCCIFWGSLLFVAVFIRYKQRIKMFSSLNHLKFLLLEEQEFEKSEIDILSQIKTNEKIFKLEYDEIHLIELIGSGGSQSKVYKAIYMREVYAFKLFHVSIFDSMEIFGEFQREVSILGSFRHKNILRFHGACLKAPRIGILMEYCSNGDLKKFLIRYKEEHQRKKKYPTDEKIRMIREIASAIYHLHESNVIHRDIKAENVLVDEHEVTKLMDFGLSRYIYDQENKSITKGIGTSFYMSPEVIRGEDYDSSVDSYAFGILCFIVLSEEWKCYGDEEGIEFKVANNPFFRPKINKIELNWMRTLIKNCWNHRPSRRPRFRDIVEFLVKKEDFSLVVYYLFCEKETCLNLEESDAQDFLLKEKSMKELQRIVEEEKKEGRSLGDYSIFVQTKNEQSNELGDFFFIELTNESELKEYLVDDCLIVFKRKKKNEYPKKRVKKKKENEKESKKLI